MRQLVYGLSIIASVVVIAAGGLWLWQQFQFWQLSQARSQAQTDAQLLDFRCGSYIETLQRAAAKPGSVPDADVKAATDGRIECLTHGIN